MRKLISTMLAGVMLAGLSIGMAGCTEETSTKEETTVKTPQGTAKETKIDKIQKSGENAPPAPSEAAKP
jgi:hypothetical protein